MKWQYRLTTNTIWATFDYGEVEADTRGEALRLAEEELTANLELVNSILSINPATANLIISMDMDQIEVEPIEVQEPKTVAKLVKFGFTTRVLVPENATNDEIIDATRSNMMIKVGLELDENLEEIIDDIECPAEAG